MTLEQGKTYRVTLKAPTSGPYKGFARRPFTGEYRGNAFIGGRRFWDGSSWHSAYDEDIESAVEVTS